MLFWLFCTITDSIILYQRTALAHLSAPLIIPLLCLVMATPSSAVVNEDDLRKELRKLRDEVQRRELPTTFKFLLMDGVVTPRKPMLPKDKMYSKAIPARLRERVEAFGTMHEWDRVAQRNQHQGPLWEESGLRAALTLRDLKKHEQDALLKGTVAAIQTPQVMARKEYLDGMALGLQSKELKKLRLQEESRMQKREALQKEARVREAERQARLEQQRQNREAARRRRVEEEDEEEEEEVRREEERLRRAQEDTPNHRVSKYLKPAFEKLWQLEFKHLGNTNPFRIVITKENCIAMGAPGYGDIVKKPMNLTWIKEKLQGARYESVAEYFADVDLMVNNALLFNSDPNNDYHLAAKELQDLAKKIRRHIVADIKKKKQGTKK